MTQDNTKNNQVTRTQEDPNSAKKYGFKVGRIVSHLDPHYMGALKVTLINFDSAGNELEDEGETVDVDYAPVFYGTTPAEHLTPGDTYADTQQSYGFWAVPPDVGTRVLCGFVDGDVNRGYWFACIQDKFMNFMVPGAQPATEYFKGKPPEGVKGKKLPTAEYNKKTDGDKQKDPTENKKALNLKFIEKLKESGLAEDDIRGITSTSARREIPSAVYGISSPGPVDKAGPRAQRGTKNEKATVPKSRLGGQSVVIDDGDDKRLRKGPADSVPYEYIDQEASSGGDKSIPHNEMVRLRTRTGHQILLHNSEDLIYISNGRGTSWIELTSNGKIDIYAQDSISVHSENDINFVADRDINLEAGRNINTNAVQNQYHTVGKNIENRVGETYKTSAAKNIELYAVKDNFITAGERNLFNSYLQTYITALQDMHVLTEKNLFSHSFENTHITADKNLFINALEGIEGIAGSGSMKLKVGTNMEILVGETTKITSGGNFETLTTGNTNITSSGNSNINSKGHYETANPIHMNGPTATKATAATEATEATVSEESEIIEEVALAALFPARVPQHEPWSGHENWDPMAVTPDKTEAKPDSQDIHIPVEDESRLATDRSLISDVWDSGEGIKYPEIPKRDR